jgi:GNAT superfamily N-acetyltransferase
VSPDGLHASVCRLRTNDIAAAFTEVRAHAPRARLVWITDGSSESELRALGCRDQDPPLTSYITALATAKPPPTVGGIEIRRVETYEEFLVAMEVADAGWQTNVSGNREAVWRRHLDRPGGDWVAILDGRPVAYGGAIAGPRGLFLTGGVTHPDARGRGAYRALVRARWDEAVQRGTPGLVVHAEEASRRVLERIGFERVGNIVELVADA